MAYLLVAGMLTPGSRPEVINQPLNHSVIFLKECDLVLTSDTWDVLVKFDLSPYEEAIAILHDELREINNVTRHPLQFEEVQRVRSVLDSLEDKLMNLKQFLPKPEQKRGLFNLGGNVLQILFGTATVADLHGLHTAVDTMSKTQEAIVHSVNGQVTLFKQLDGAVRHNQDTLTNLTSVIKDYVLKVQGKFQNTVSRLEWLMKQQETDNAVRRLEFYTTQLEIQLEELLSAFQALQQGKLPLGLLTFTQLHAILKNVTLSLPSGFELILGSHYSSTPWYFSNIRAAMLADYHSFMLMIRLPLTTGDRKFEVLRTFAFPKKISDGTYVSIYFEHGYLAVNNYYQKYLTLTDFELSQCKGENIKICEASKPVRSKDSELNECEFHMFLNAEAANSKCRRLVSADPPVPDLRRHGDVILYFMPEPSQVVLRCRHNQSWVTNSIVVEGAGLLNNALACHITAGNLQLYAQLSGETRVQPKSPVTIITPSHQAVTSPSEMDALKNIAGEQDTYGLLSTLSARRLEPTVENLLTLHSIVKTHENCSSWTAAHVYVSIIVSLCLVILYHCLCKLHNKLCKCMACLNTRTTTDNTAPRVDEAVPQQVPSQASNQAPVQEGATSHQATAQHAVYALRGNPS